MLIRKCVARKEEVYLKYNLKNIQIDRTGVKCKRLKELSLLFNPKPLKKHKYY